MGKIRTKVLGTEEESHQREKDKTRRKGKKQREEAIVKSGKGQHGRIADLSVPTEEVKVKTPEEIEKEAAALLHPEELHSEALSEHVLSGLVLSEVEGVDGVERAKKNRPLKIRSKNYQNAIKLFDKTKKYPLKEAIELVKKTNYAKFDATVEVHLVLLEKDLKITLTFPHSTGKGVKVMAFVSPEKEEEAKKAGADFIADETTLAKIEKGEVNFQAAVATPDWMPRLGKLAKVLGPKGLMPNPKSGNITTEPEKVIKALKSGQITLKTESNTPLIHTVIGKVSFKTEDLEENLRALINAIGPAKIASLTLKSTMSPGVKVDLRQT